MALLGFGSSPAALAYAAAFAVVYGLSAPGLALFRSPSGALQGAGETRLPFYARTTGMFGFFVGFSYLAVEFSGLGLTGVYAGVILAHVWMGAVMVLAFRHADWGGRQRGYSASAGASFSTRTDPEIVTPTV